MHINLPVLATPPLMASPTTHCLVLQGIVRQDQVPSSEEETVSYSTDNTRAQILNIVNAVWDDGLFITFGLLPNVITPNSDRYRTDRCLETIRHAKRAPVLFIWMKAASFASSIFSTKCGICRTFFVPASGPFQSLDLPYILLRFMDRYIRSENYSRFNLVSLSYKLGPSGSFGVLLFDNGLRNAYMQARLRARRSRNAFRRSFDYPICTWPNNVTHLTRPEVIAQLMRGVGLLVAL
ncbi:hypothetical protein B0H14DRAFT_2878001 [Mycena olivaceomarginata]|nr:hypothetical protein B0H14DRAFT_2878001 [Mycena olivaceomarginata]